MSPSEPRELSTRQKALALNLDGRKYGTIAEIGAGQEVARWFFVAGHAAGTVAKTISAYDMAVSDSLYGHATRYVSRERLESMLTHEFEQLRERLDGTRGESTGFFAFADTVATRRTDRPGSGDGWMGIRFQDEPRAAPSEILIHVRMQDRVRVHEQEALGIAGVNLIYGAFHLTHDPKALVASLVDGLGRERIEIDVVKLSGPVFSGVDPRLVSLQLVEQGLTDAAMFLADGELVQPSEILWKRPVLVQRGAFRPVTKLDLDVLEQAHARFMAEPDVGGDEPVCLLEMTLRDLERDRRIAHEDFLARVDVLRGLGHTVLISSDARYFRLVEILYRYTQRPIGIAVGVPALRAIVDAAHYADLAGGLLESVGRLFKAGVKLYVYPWRDPRTREVIGIGRAADGGRVRPLLEFLLENGWIVPLSPSDDALLDIDVDDVLARIQRGDGSWQALVPERAARAIREGCLFGYAEPEGPAGCQHRPERA